MKSVFLLSEFNIDVNLSSQDKKRTFNGIANSGLPFVYHGERAIVDMASVTLSDKVPALLLHDRNIRVGFGKLSLDGHKLIITGTLLNNDHAKAIADEADDGFPWQMSAHVSAGIKQEIPQGEHVIVNGQNLVGPITILKNCTISEVSFTPTGVDSNTIAHILSKTHANSSNPANSKPNKEATMSDNQSKDTIDDKFNKDSIIADLKAQITALTTEIKALKDEKAQVAKQAKADKVNAKLSQAGFKQDKDGNWQGLSGSTVNLLLSAEDNELDGIIGDIRPKHTSADYFMSEQYSGHGTQGDTGASQSSQSALLKVIDGKV